MSDNKDVPAQPLVIVRRRRSSEEGHHGGVWKIAYADFMTAMMAFFLVMWLVNAADKKTIVQVAAYFNPMRLTDRTEVTSGLEDQTDQSKEKKKKKSYAEKMKESAEPEKKPEAEKQDKDKDRDKAKSEASPTPDEAKAQEEGAMMQEPQKVLQKIVDEAKVRPRAQPPAVDGQLRDPFDLKASSAPKQKSQASTETKAEKSKAVSIGNERTLQKQAAGALQPPDKSRNAQANAVESNAEVKSDSKADTKADGKVDNKKETAQAQALAAEALANEIRKAASDVAEQIGRNIEVKAVPEGLLISLIDGARDGMFEIGSAKPSVETILMLERLAPVIQLKKGAVLVRGHTDGRSYKGGMYDNWRLSTARAHMTMQMLLRGGLPQERFAGIEGRADTDLRNPSDKEDPQNRRIDILIKNEVP